MFQRLKSVLWTRSDVTALPAAVDRPALRAALLRRRADELLQSGRFSEALQCYDVALAITRDLAGEQPGGHRHPWMIASLQYSRASVLTILNRPAEAITALEESEERYREAGAANVPNIDLLLADVHARRGLAQHTLGHGISAVLDLDAATVAYRQRFTGEQGDPYALDLARVLAMNAYVLHTWGDTDLAVASADAAMRLYNQEVRAGRYQVHGTMHEGYWQMAADVAAELHAAHNRFKIAMAISTIAVVLARSRFAHQRTVEHRRMLARALVRRGLYMQAMDGSGSDEIAQGQALDAQVVQQVQADWERIQAGAHPAQITLATALAVAAQELGADRVPDILASTLTRPAIEVAFLSPSDRCEPALAAEYARQLAEISLALWKARRAEALRIGIEAHYLFAVASRMQTSPMRYQMHDYGPTWARVLLACAQEYESRRQAGTALDLAAWAGSVATRMLPGSLLDTTLRPLIRECIEQHGRLCIANGNRKMGNEILQQARSLWNE